jgi:hypothetical protein
VAASGETAAPCPPSRLTAAASFDNCHSTRCPPATRTCALHCAQTGRELSTLPTRRPRGPGCDLVCILAGCRVHPEATLPTGQILTNPNLSNPLQRDEVHRRLLRTRRNAAVCGVLGLSAALAQNELLYAGWDPRGMEADVLKVRPHRPSWPCVARASVRM